MAGLTLYTSNRLEVLASELARVLARPLPSPMEPETIVVQSRGMERWIGMELARHMGICANCRFPFPNAFVEGLFRRFFPALPDRTPFAPEIMTWKLMDLLPACLERKGFDSLRAYLGHDPEGLKLYQLCRRIADTFDQYLLFRPSMIFAWESGKGRVWQAQLWRELIRSLGDRHRAALGRDLAAALATSTDAADMLPRRISVFGISALPRFHVELLAAAAQHAEVNLFLMNPCAEYWGDIVSDWEAKRAEDKERDRGAPRDLHLEKGNSLLASMGALGRDFFDLLSDFPCRERPSFEEPTGDRLLFQIQSEIVHLRERRGADPDGEVVRGDDASVHVHCCHGPMREMEVLRDQLLRMFEEIPGLMPGDVLVMTPDIETYSPCIQAVFHAGQDEVPGIPFSIADRSLRGESPLADVFLAVLDLPEGRFGASEVMGLLESREVRRRFGMEEEDLETVRRWVKETRIRWGVDERSRTRAGLPPFTQNTWRAGLDRLLLGYALPAEGASMFGGIPPCDLVEGDAADLLGKTARFIEVLASLVEGLELPRTLADWADYLTLLIDSLFSTDPEGEREALELKRLVEDLRLAGGIAGFEEKVDVRLIRWHLKRGLAERGFGFGFLTGAVTFCAMVPMRSIPFRVICLVGMNHDAYPRQSRPVGFDLMAAHPLPGDRSRRNDDRYLFLEAILSARDRLYVSYVGRSVQDNAPIPPSVLVSELLDYISQGFGAPSGDILDSVLIQHPLQAFNPAYFSGGGRLFSYSNENCEAARRLLGPRRDPAPFLSRGLPPPGDEWDTVSIEDLCAFFRNPARFLLNSRLRILLDEAETVLEDREAFDVHGLDKYELENDLLQKRLQGLDPDELRALEKAAGRLPHGTVGQCIYDKLSGGVERFHETLRGRLQMPALEALPVDLTIGESRITGQVKGIYPAMRIQYRYGAIRAKDRLDAWIRHLALNCMAPEGRPRVSLLAGLDPGNEDDGWLAVEFGPVPDSRGILEDLLKIFRRGLIRPLHFFPESSWVYVQRLQSENEILESALGRARITWAGSEFHRGESRDPYFLLCFGDRDPMDGEFQEISEAVFEPLLESLREPTGMDGDY